MAEEVIGREQELEEGGSPRGRAARDRTATKRTRPFRWSRRLSRGQRKASTASDLLTFQ
jgi:hypothetical protein